MERQLSSLGRAARGRQPPLQAPQRPPPPCRDDGTRQWGRPEVCVDVHTHRLPPRGHRHQPPRAPEGREGFPQEKPLPSLLETLSRQNARCRGGQTSPEIPAHHLGISVRIERLLCASHDTRCLEIQSREGRSWIPWVQNLVGPMIKVTAGPILCYALQWMICAHYTLSNVMCYR